MQFVLLPAIVIQTERPYRDVDQGNREIAKRISHCVVNEESPLGHNISATKRGFFRIRA